MTEPPSEARREASTLRAARWIAALLGVATLAAVAFVAVYWVGGQPQAEGALLGVALVASGLALALWARHLLPSGPYVEERPPLDEGAAESAALVADLERDHELSRRPFLIRLAALAAAALGGAILVPLRSLGPRPSKAALRTGWHGGRRATTADGRPVRAQDVPLGGLVTVFPEGSTDPAQGQAVLIRVAPGDLRLPPERRSWAPGGLVAYSKVCTHAGCPVGLYQADSQTLLCPCHQSVFDVLDGARPVTGPAAWPLPQLPLTVDDDGTVRSSGDFSDPVGPGWWKEGS